MILTITEEHLDRGIAATSSKDVCRFQSENCVVAQAARDLLGDLFNACADDYISLNNNMFFIVAPLRKIIHLFDDEKFDELRKELPLSIDIGEMRLV